jgi:thiamine-monophosphate kinase
VTDDLATVGERAALARIIPRLRTRRRKPDDVLLGPGDDAAILAAPDGRVLLSTDAMVEGPDFRLAWSSFHSIGFKAIATNLADIAAMGGRPTGLLVALAAPGDTLVSDLEELAAGMADACGRLTRGLGLPVVEVVGGDLTRSAVLSVSVTVVGSLAGREAVLRSGARPGHSIGYSGRLGLAAAALRLLFATGEDDRAAIEELFARKHALLMTQLSPSPPIAAGIDAAEAGATAMLDVSDGLLLDATRIAEASGVILDLDPAVLDEYVDELLDAAQGRKLSVPPPTREEALGLVLGGGEDHGLLACFPGEPPEGFRRLGTVRQGAPAVLIGSEPVDPSGWDSFAPS